MSQSLVLRLILGLIHESKLGPEVDPWVDPCAELGPEVDPWVDP